MRLLLLSTDNRNSWSLDGTPPRLPSEPGTSIRVSAAFHGPLTFGALRIGAAARALEGKTVGPHGVLDVDPGEPLSRWRIDEVRIDDVPNRIVADALENEAISRNHLDRGHDTVRLSMEPFGFGVGSQVSIAATNVGDAAAYFYATWEMHDVL